VAELVNRRPTAVMLSGEMREQARGKPPLESTLTGVGKKENE